MKKLYLLIGFLIIMLASCTVFNGTYQLGLEEVDRPINANERYGESKIVSFQEDGKNKHRYEDSLISIIWIPSSTRFDFVLENKSNYSVKIIWDEAVYVNPDGLSQRVMHSEVPYANRHSSQPPTVVIKGGKLIDVILPVDNVYHYSSKYGSGWGTKPLFIDRASTQDDLVTVSNYYVGKAVKILLPIEIEGTINEYIFSFKIEGFTQKTY